MKHIKTGEKYFKLSLSVIFVFVLIGIFYNIAMRNVENKNKESINTQNTNTKSTSIKLPHGEVLSTEVADTVAARSQGLSGRDSLCDTCAMLFVFPENRYYGFWMKDMNFNIDIVFLDKNKQIVDIYKNVDKNSYHKPLTRNPYTGRMENTSQIFKNTTPAMYVIELPAYAADNYGLKVGNVLDIRI